MTPCEHQSLMRLEPGMTRHWCARCGSVRAVYNIEGSEKYGNWESSGFYGMGGTPSERLRMFLAYNLGFDPIRTENCLIDLRNMHPNVEWDKP